MQHAATARALLQRLHPWLGKAVHPRWRVRRSIYLSEVEALLVALAHHRGRMPPRLSFEIQGFLGRLYREWFPREWRANPTYSEMVTDFRWWLGVAERWTQAPPKAARGKRRIPLEPLAGQPKKLLRLLGLPATCTRVEFMIVWRRFLKAHHPDLNPDQTAEERRLFAEAVAMWRR
jgi:hypothetical protein